ncbi:coiled-coil domain-containing protein 91 [Lissotriton helveticus]
MDDDEFGGFEAAETFGSGDGETQSVSPAIPWAAFPAVSGIPGSKTGADDSLLELPQSTACLLPSEMLMTSGVRSLSATQAIAPSVFQSTLTEQVLATDSATLDEVPVSSLNVLEDAGVEALANVLEDAEPLESKRAEASLQQVITNLDLKLQAAEEEKGRMKKELEDMMKTHGLPGTDYLKEKNDEIISHRDRYRQLQEVHKNELEDLRKAGHEALTIIVEEFKALLHSSAEQQGEASEKHYKAAIEKQSQRCEELLTAQYERLLEMLDKEKERFEEKMKEAFAQQLQEHKEAVAKCLDEERRRSKDALEAAIKVEQEIMKEAICKAVEEERQRMENVYSKEKESWEVQRKNDRDCIAQAIKEALAEERTKSQDLVKAAIAEEQKRTEAAVQEAVRQTREELMEYATEQKRLDQVARQRSLSSLELFLTCAQKQLASLIEDRPVAELKEN